jgi:hypothetical protein
MKPAARGGSLGKSVRQKRREGVSRVDAINQALAEFKDSRAFRGAGFTPGEGGIFGSAPASGSVFAEPKKRRSGTRRSLFARAEG